MHRIFCLQILVAGPSVKMAESKTHESKGHKNPYYHWPRTPELLMPPPPEWKGQAEVVRPMTGTILLVGCASAMRYAPSFIRWLSRIHPQPLSARQPLSMPAGRTKTDCDSSRARAPGLKMEGYGSSSVVLVPELYTSECEYGVRVPSAHCVNSERHCIVAVHAYSHTYL